jgi:pimeloyl-ACP methyl ester carboxylesterase
MPTIVLENGTELKPVCYNKDSEGLQKIYHVYGGCFSGGSPRNGATFAKAMSEHLKIEVWVLDFRKDSLEVALDDMVEVIKNTTSNTEIVLSGGSSGGWLAHALAASGKLEEFGISVSKLMMFCPVADPNERRKYLQACTIEAAVVLYPEPFQWKVPVLTPAKALEMLKKQDAFFGEQAAPKLDPLHIPTLVVAATHDKNVPIHIILHAMHWASKTIVYGDEGHDLQYKNPSRELRRQIKMFVMPYAQV